MTAAAAAAIVVVPFAAWQVVRAVLSYRGNRSAKARSAALQYFSEQDVAKGRKHAKAYLIPGLARRPMGLLFLWAAIFLGPARWMESAAVSATSALPLQVAFFLAMFIGAHTAFFAPLSIYSGFVIGRRLGTLKQTFLQWLLFNAKGAAISFAISWGIFSTFLFIVRGYPSSWWVIVAAGLTFFTVLLMFLSPIVLAPIFYRFSRLERGDLRDRLLELCQKAGVKAQDVFIQHESKVSTHTNAYFTGIGKSRRIVLFDNLLSASSPDEIAAVVAHEAGHWSRRHILIGIGLSTASIFAGSFLLFHLFGLRGTEDFFDTSIRRLSVLPAVSLLTALAGTFIEPCAAAVSRALERQADALALELTGDAKAFITMQIKLVRENILDLLPHPLLVRLYATHPLALERIRSAVETGCVAKGTR